MRQVIGLLRVTFHWLRAKNAEYVLRHMHPMHPDFYFLSRAAIDSRAVVETYLENGLNRR